MKNNSFHIFLSRVISAMLVYFFLPLANAQDPGFFLNDWQEKHAEIPAHTLKSKPGTAASVHIQVDMNQKLNRVPKYIYGNNAVTWGGNMNEHATVMTDINNLNPHVLRWPGGNLSQVYFWNVSADQRPDDIPENSADFIPWFGVNDDNWQMSNDDYYDLLENTNSTGIPCVNYSYARYGTGPDPVGKAAHLAAEWVRYDNGRSKFWEIGNENFGGWEAGYQIDVTNNQDGQPEFINGQLYGQHCRVFIDSMRAAAAEIGVEIKIGVVAYDAENSYDDIQTVWNEGMMPEVGHLADFLIVHSYFTPYEENSTVSTILNSHHVPAEIMTTMVNDMAEAGKPMIPVAFTEWNIFAVGSMQMVSYINGMHSALVLGEFVKTGYGLATRWDLTNGWDNGNDHGMFSRGGEPGVENYNPRPVFFYMYYFQEYFGDRMISSPVTGNSDVIAYASSFSSGEAGMVIINKSTSDETIEIELDNFEPGGKYYYHLLTGGDDNGDFSRKVFLNGYGTVEEGGGPDNYETIKAFASEIEGGIKVNLPSLSVIYLMVEVKPPLTFVSSKIDSDPGVIHVELSDTVLLSENPAGFEVFANGSELLAITGIEVDSENIYQLNILLEQDVLPEDAITLSYSGSDVMNQDSVALVSFSDVQVNNLLPGATPQLQDAFTTGDGGLIYLIFNMGMQVSDTLADVFTLTLIGDPLHNFKLSDIVVDQEDSLKLVITLAEPLYAEYELSLSYSGSSVTSLDNVLLEPFAAFDVTNHSTGTQPELLVAEVSAPGFTIVASFNKSMKDISGYDTLFSVNVNGENFTIDSIESTDEAMTIFLEDYIRYDDIVMLSYEGTAVESVDGGILQTIEDFTVLNDLTEPVVIDIPGMIDAELFSINMGMFLVQCKDAGGGYNLAYIDPEDWVDYEVDVLQTGYYRGTLRTAAAFGPGHFVLQYPDGDTIEQDTVIIPVTGGWQEWRSIPFEVILYEGRQRLRFAVLTSDININWLNLEFDRTLQGDTVSAVETKLTPRISIYPNPVREVLNIEIADHPDDILIQVIDVLGQTVYEKSYMSLDYNSMIQLNMSHFQEGMYLIRVVSDQLSFHRSIIIK